MLSYTELIRIPTFEERFEYVKQNGVVGRDTFGFDRYLNQAFYHSEEWRLARRDVIARDFGHDLAMTDEEYEIKGMIYVHHLNPITPEDFKRSSDILLNPEYLVCVSFDTHNALHYGDAAKVARKKAAVRRPNDMCPWRH